MAQLKTNTGQIVEAEAGSELYGQYEAGGATEQPNLLTAEDMAPVPTEDFNFPEEQTSISVPANLNNTVDPLPQQELTQEEQRVQEGTDIMTQLNMELLGESGMRTELEKQQGLPELFQTKTDLSNRLNTLIADQKAIPLQIQQESIGRGRTAGGVAPLQTARLRENAINALSTSALLQATQGNIATAQTLVDRAVKQQFDPIREELAVLKENLTLIKESPKFSIEQKNRADEQLRLAEEREKQITKQEADKNEILNVANEVAKFGVPMEVLQAISNAKSPTEAYAIAQTTGVYDQEKIQLEFENSIKTGEFNLKKQKLESEIAQQAFDQDMSIMSYELDRDKYSTDTEFKNAQLVLDRMRTEYTVDKIQADIDKIYNDIEQSGEITVADQLKINELQEKKNEKKAQETIKRISLGNELEEVDDKLSQIDSLIETLDNEMVGVVGATWASRIRFGEMITGADKEFVGTLKNIIDQKTLDALTGLKAKGATLGAISEKELAILANSAAKFNTWEKKKDGVGTGIYDVSEKVFTEELKRVREATERLKKGIVAERALITPKYETMTDYLLEADEAQVQALDNLKNQYPTMTDDDLLEIMNEQAGGSNFNQVGSDTNKALPEEISKAEEGEPGGQCGRFVNKATGLGLGDSYASKMAKMDKSITEPAPGMVFVMPYKDTGHTGFIVSVNKEKGTVTVKDSNYSLDEKVRVHEIPINKISGLRRIT